MLAFTFTKHKRNVTSLSTWARKSTAGNALRFRGNLNVKGISRAETEQKFLFANQVIDSLQNITNVAIINPLPYFFPKDDYSILSLDGASLYRDGDHISRVGAQMLKPLFEPTYDLYQPQQGASDNP